MLRWRPVPAWQLRAVYFVAEANRPLSLSGGHYERDKHGLFHYAGRLAGGVSIASIAASLTALVIVGTVALPLEIRHLGKKMALSRNLFSLLFVFVIAIVIWRALQ
ncbi:MAG: hypothetical protein AUK03_00760 [Anaerolineae bacterium CG2_30_64_16]|nr:MAG: hypothetical protein AUK03_00760 [Anaerolineae bacterium CG2_30_64_16]